MSWKRERVAEAFVIVDAKIRANARPRFSRNGHAYSVPADKAAKKRIADEFLLKCGDVMSEWGDEVELHIDCHRQYPKSYPNWREGEPDTYKPDADNITKLVKDALTGVAWSDDCLVTHETTIKHPRFRRPCDRMEIRLIYWRNTCTKEKK